jgi:hypothetical protein
MLSAVNFALASGTDLVHLLAPGNETIPDLLTLPMTRIIIPDFMKKEGRARLKFILWQLGRLGLLRSVAFRPRLTTGLALS